MHTHIALVGGQRMPIAIGIRHFGPDQVILVCSRETQAQGQLIKDYFPNITFRDDVILDARNIGDTFARVRQLAAELNSEEQLTLNLTGGMKPWSIAFYEAFRGMENARCFYIDQTNTLTDIREPSDMGTESQAPVQLETLDFSIMDYLLLHGAHVQDKRVFKSGVEGVPNEITPMDKQVANEFSQLANGNAESIYRYLTNDHKFRQRFGGRLDVNAITYDTALQNVAIPPNCAMSWDRTPDSNGNQRISFTINGTQRVFRSPHACDIVLNSAWNEVLIGCKFGRWKPTQEIFWAVKFQFEQGTHTQNEVDLILRSRKRLFFIECKTHLDGTIAIDQHRARVEKFGGRGSVPVLVVADSPSEDVKECCRINNVTLFSLRDNSAEEIYSELTRLDKLNLT